MTENKSDELHDTEDAEETTAPDAQADDTADEPAKSGIGWPRLFAFAVLPALALLLALAAGFLKWQDNSVRSADIARIESVQAAKDITVAMLSYQSTTVEQELGAARERLTGKFRDSYSSMINEVVIPGAKGMQVSAVTSIPGAASVSAEPDRAVVLLYVDQSVSVGPEPPTTNASSVRVTLDKVDDRWLISEFVPVQ